MLANCALGSFVTYNLGCSVSGRRDPDQSRSSVRKPSAALGVSRHTLGGSRVCGLQGHLMAGDGC